MMHADHHLDCRIVEIPTSVELYISLPFTIWFKIVSKSQGLSEIFFSSH